MRILTTIITVIVSAALSMNVTTTAMITIATVDRDADPVC